MDERVCIICNTPDEQIDVSILRTNLISSKGIDRLNILGVDTEQENVPICEECEYEYFTRSKIKLY